MDNFSYDQCPNLLAVASTALGQGRKAALQVTLGKSTGMLVWAVAVAFGLLVIMDGLVSGAGKALSC